MRSSRKRRRSEADSLVEATDRVQCDVMQQIRLILRQSVCEEGTPARTAEEISQRFLSVTAFWKFFPLSKYVTF